MVKVPKYMLAMLLVTGLYLTIEIPFSIYLVRILGGSATEADIDTVEKVGRLLTGIAIALAYVGIRIYPRFHAAGFSFGETTKHALFRAIPIIALTYVGLHIYGEVRGMFSTGDARKEAFISNLAKRTIAEDGLVGLSPSVDPSWLATVSGMPALLTSDTLVYLSGQSLEELARREAVRSVGDAKTARETFAAELEAEIAPAYKQFSRAVSQHRATVNDRERIAEREWFDYRDELRSYFGNSVPRPGTSSHARVIRKMREDGLAVSDRFRLDDRATFNSMVMRKVVREANSEFAKGIALNVGKGSRLTPDSSEAQFHADPAVQRQVRSGLSMKLASGLVLTPDMKLETFRDGVYPALIKRAAAKILETASMRGASFTSQVNRETGEAAVKAATLPSTALLLSLAGALFHIHKFSGYFVLVFGTAIRSRMVASKPSRHAFAAAALGLAVFAMKPGIPAHIGTALESSDGGVYGKLVAGAISLQPGMFLIGETMASYGPWQLIYGRLPSPRLPPVAVAEAYPGVSAEQTASVIPLPEAKPVVEMAEADGFVPPVPLPRPH
ncbi:hypothetical protein GOB57_09900 [Sinorhizobium meliloti]|nr:hypothetical protein [Sinorhizobium meliloti]